MFPPQNLCWNCMTPSLVNGRCNRCGAFSNSETTDRPINALPKRYCLVGRYYLGNVLGSGGFGITYLAWDTQTSQRVAIKEFFPRTSSERNRVTLALDIHKGDEGYYFHVKESFLQEAKFIYNMRSVNEIIKVYHLFELNNTAYYVMEYLEGKDLKHYLRENGKVSWSKLSVLIRPVINALIAVHKVNFIHRDISPDNIFILNNGSTKLIDFGSARSFVSSTHYTMIFNRSFAAPEMYNKNGNQGPWTDVYSLAATMYYSLSGKIPVSPVDRSEERMTHHSDPLTPLALLCPDVPKNVSDAIDRALSLDIQNRFSNAGDFGNALFAQAPSNEKLLLYCVEGLKKGRCDRLNPGETITVGKLPSCKIVYPATGAVSKRHCTFYTDENGIVYVTDENSTNGTLVGGIKIKPFEKIRLGANSTIQIGNDKYVIILG